MYRENLQFAKFFTQFLVNNLRKVKDTTLKNSYIRSYYCSTTLTLNDDNSLSSERCKNRFCIYCNRVRTAELINKYLFAISSLEDPVFVTLTLPNCTAENLTYTLKRMKNAFVNISVFLRRSEFVLKGVRKLEITYNHKMNTYHPHFHLIVESRVVGKAIINKWLSTFSDAVEEAQDIREADINSCKELFKYFTKLSTKNTNFNFIALNNIFEAMRGQRVFFTYKLKSENIEGTYLVDDTLKKDKMWSWNNQLKDWISKNGEYFGDLTISEMVNKMKKVDSEVNSICNQ